jgi:hypothetical protein
MTPREESDALLNSALAMAMRLLTVHGSHIPFAMVLDQDGAQSNIAADDSETQDRDVLALAVQDQVKEMCAAGKLQAIAFARNISFRKSQDGPSTAAVEVNLDHVRDNAVTCILPYELGPTAEPQPGELFAIDPRVTFFDLSRNGKGLGASGVQDSNVKTIQLTPYIRFNVPADWADISVTDGSARLRTPDGGSFSAQAREFRKPAQPGTRLGPTSEQMISMQVSEFGVSSRALAPGRAYATHSISIGEPGQQRECRAWHIVNQVDAWHHETLLFIYEPPPGKGLDQLIVAVLDNELPECKFGRALGCASSGAPNDQGKLKPWWKFW